MKWFIPAWNGDWRMIPDPLAPEKRTILEIKRPTENEKRLLRMIRHAFNEKGWLKPDDAERVENPSSWRTTTASIAAPLPEIGPYLASLLKPGPAVLTAVRFADDRIECVETSAMPEPEPEKKEEPPAPIVTATSTEPKLPEAKPSEEAKELAKKPDAVAAATVKRPTPSCPDCFQSEDVNKPATECLLAFLSEDEHASWAEHRYIVVRGGITGHEYLIAHRNSRIAEENQRICFDLSDNKVMHFHQTAYPPEEEVLAAKLILEHREPWLRNEATAFGGHSLVFKNPFGDSSDGIPDTNWTFQVGAALLDPARMLERALKMLAPHRALEVDGDTEW